MLGGLVPELLCAGSGFQHAGTIDIDVQVDLEIACGAVNTARLEQALCNAGFAPENERIWRWVADGSIGPPVVKFELLADLHDQPAEATISFDACENLGAVNLRGTGFAARDIEVRELSVRDGGITHTPAAPRLGFRHLRLNCDGRASGRRDAGSLMLPASLTRRLVNHVRPQDVTEGYAADWTMEQLRDAAQRIADKIDELIRAGGPAPAARAA